MSECAQETRNAFPERPQPPEATDGIMFISSTGYYRRRWQAFIDDVAALVLSVITPADMELTVAGDWIGRNYYDLPALKDKRFRLFRDGILLNATQWRPLNEGGFQLLIPYDIMEAGQRFTIIRY